jgi:1-hydroxycarotenoid 3,4-desaturase
MAEVAVIGAGMAGLVAALRLAQEGHAVTVLERAAAPGGKMREVTPGERPIDAGPTVFTMRWVLEEVFREVGESLDEHLTLHPVDTLARHAWAGGDVLDLYADTARSAEAIRHFAGAAEARGFGEFCARARRVYETLEGPFIRAPRPSPIGLAASAGLAGVADLWRVSPFTSLWKALGEHFRDPRLRQLFGRYATYCGASPFAAPATLMLIAHVEQQGVWLVEGGMHRIAAALEALAVRRGATFRYGAEVAEVLVEGGRCAGVRLADGERVAAEAVVANADASALHAGLLGAAAARAVPAPQGERSLSAVTWCMEARAQGFDLLRHSVFFSDDYRAEFDSIFGQGRLPAEPTTYICAQDRDDLGGQPDGTERLLVLVNAPATHLEPRDIERCRQASLDLLTRCGLTLTPTREVMTTPMDFAALFQGTAGALYGQATHGWKASFSRPGTGTRLPGLYLAGGSVHPGAGVPMAAMSGRLAAARVISDLAFSTRRRPMAMPGGISTRSARMGGTG